MKNKVTAKMLRRAAKKLCRKLKVEGPCYVEVEDPKIKNKGGNDEIRIRKKQNTNNARE